MNDFQDMAKRFAGELKAKKCPHLVLWLGSAISYFPPSLCRGVKDIKFDLVLKQFRGSMELAADSEMRSGLQELVHRMLDRDSTLHKEIDNLPFEQFMNCLHEADSALAFEIIRLACRDRRDGFPNGDAVGPNLNHYGFVQMASHVLQNKLCKEVTIVTTNYDRFLEEALSNLRPDVKLEKVKEAAFPTWRMKFEGAPLNIMKPHGCLSEPSSLVYTTRSWTDFLLEKGWRDHFKKPDAILWAGYSFSDPHLRPLFIDWLTKGKRPESLALAFGNGETGKGRHRKPGKGDYQTGAEQLGLEFHSRYIREHEAFCDLNVLNRGSEIQADKHPVGIILKYLDPQFENRAVLCRESIPQSVIAPFNKFSEVEAIDFLSNLIECCSLGDAEGILCSYLFGKEPGRIKRPHLAARYLLQLGHIGKYAEAAEKCGDIIKDASENPGMKIIAHGYQSFALTIKNQDVKKGVLAMEALQAGRAICSHTPGEWTWEKSFFTHRDLHFQVKLFLYTQISSGIDNSVREGNSFQNACSLEEKLRSASHCEKTSGNIYEFTQLEDLRAQILCYAAVCSNNLKDKGKYSEKAVEAAQKVREAYYSLGQLNSVVLSDRTLGWAYLARQCALGGPIPSRNEYMEKAIKAFASGLLRSLECSDETLRTKLAANLLRLFPIEARIGSAGKGCVSDKGMVSLACKRMIEKGSKTENQSVSIVADYLTLLYSNNGRLEVLKNAFSKFKDTIKYPIFFPPDP